MPILTIVELTLRNAKIMSDYFGFRIFINFRKTNYFSSLEPALSMNNSVAKIKHLPKYI